MERNADATTGERRSRKGKVYVWMQVTEDKYSLPIVIADTSEELARKCGVKLNTIHHYISLFASGKKHGFPKYIRVVLREEDLDEQNSGCEAAAGPDSGDV